MSDLRNNKQQLAEDEAYATGSITSLKLQRQTVGKIHNQHTLCLAASTVSNFSPVTAINMKEHCNRH